MPPFKRIRVARGLMTGDVMRSDLDQTINDQLGRRLLEVVQMLLAEHQRQVADGEVDEVESQPLRQDLFIQPHPTREAA